MPTYSFLPAYIPDINEQTTDDYSDINEQLRMQLYKSLHKQLEDARDVIEFVADNTNILEVNDRAHEYNLVVKRAREWLDKYYDK